MTRSLPWWRRLWRLVVPPLPDFFGMLEEQADNLSATVTALSEYLKDCDKELAARINDLVDEGHALRDDSLHRLYSSFITPIDREDIYTLAMSFDHILDYIRNTVREVEVLQVGSDQWMRSMTAELVNGTASLKQGLAQLRASQAEGVSRIVQTRTAERRIEDLYRDALADMFEGEAYQKLSAANGSATVQECLEFVVNRIKRREVYRHISNAADRLARAGEAMRDISIKYDTGK